MCSNCSLFRFSESLKSTVPVQFLSIPHDGLRFGGRLVKRHMKENQDLSRVCLTLWFNKSQVSPPLQSLQSLPHSVWSKRGLCWFDGLGWRVESSFWISNGLHVLKYKVLEPSLLQPFQLHLGDGASSRRRNAFRSWIGTWTKIRKRKVELPKAETTSSDALPETKRRGNYVFWCFDIRL